MGHRQEHFGHQFSKSVDHQLLGRCVDSERRGVLDEILVVHPELRNDAHSLLSVTPVHPIHKGFAVHVKCELVPDGIAALDEFRIFVTCRPIFGPVITGEQAGSAKLLWHLHTIFRYPRDCGSGRLQPNRSRTQYVLSADKRSYREVSGTVKSLLPHPMPISIMFWAGAGGEPALLKIASAYEAATKPTKLLRGTMAIGTRPKVDRGLSLARKVSPSCRFRVKTAILG